MRSAAILFVVALLAGCSTSSEVRINAGALPPGPSAGINVQGGGSHLSVLIALGVLAAANYRADALRSREHPFQLEGRPWSFQQPELEENRKVNEQDCSKPIENFSANLKCR
jgi:hypothetical protein